MLDIDKKWPFFKNMNLHYAAPSMNYKYVERAAVVMIRYQFLVHILRLIFLAGLDARFRFTTIQRTRMG